MTSPPGEPALQQVVWRGASRRRRPTRCSEQRDRLAHCGSGGNAGNDGGGVAQNHRTGAAQYRLTPEGIRSEGVRKSQLPMKVPRLRLLVPAIGLAAVRALVGGERAESERLAPTPPPSIGLLACSASPQIEPSPTQSADVKPPSAAGKPDFESVNLQLAIPDLLVSEGDLAALPGHQERRLRWIMECWEGSATFDPEPDLPYRKILSSLFPDPQHIATRHVIIEGGLVTAIKRKNPLGLLNPDVLRVSW